MLNNSGTLLRFFCLIAAAGILAGCGEVKPRETAKGAGNGAKANEQTAPEASGVQAGTPIQVTGELGSPSATTTISGRQLPAPDPKFGGVIKDNATQSKA